MYHVHWSLVWLAFVVGAALTAALMIRPVKTQVPVDVSMEGADATVALATAAEPIVDELPTTEVPLTAASCYASYGPGSARAAADGTGPTGWLVKGRTDTRLYYTPDDPTYDPTVAQVWFSDEEAAKRAFFTPWRTSIRK